MLELAGSKAASGIAQLEGPEEIAGLLEIGPDGENLVDQVFHTHDAVTPEMGLDQLVVGQRDALAVNLAVTALVHKVAHGFDRWVAICDVRLNDFQHFRRGFGESHEDAIVDLQKSQQLEDFARFRGDLVDTERKLLAKFLVQRVKEGKR